MSVAHVSRKGIPEFAPVTMITLPERSGMSSTLNLEAGGNPWSKIAANTPKAESDIENAEASRVSGVCAQK